MELLPTVEPADLARANEAYLASDGAISAAEYSDLLFANATPAQRAESERQSHAAREASRRIQRVKARALLVLREDGEPNVLTERSDVRALIAKGQKEGGLRTADLYVLPEEITETVLMDDLIELIEAQGVPVLPDA